MTRTETDSLGSIEIDAECDGGPQNARARRLVRIRTDRFPPGLIRAVTLAPGALAESPARPMIQPAASLAGG